jgi:hypothetical protein
MNKVNYISIAKKAAAIQISELKKLIKYLINPLLKLLILWLIVRGKSLQQELENQV